MSNRLVPEQLYRKCDPAQFSFDTTAELKDLTEIIGQDRAMDAIQFGITIRQDGYNLFAMGSSALAKLSVVRNLIMKQAANEPTPDDWCYTNNFDLAHKPIALRLPPGQAQLLNNDIKSLVKDLCLAIPAAFESDNYRSRKQTIETEFKERHNNAFEQLRKQAHEWQLELMRTQTGIVFAAMVDEKVLSPEEFQKLPKQERELAETHVLELQERLQRLVEQSPLWEKEGREKIEELNQDVMTVTVGHLISDLVKKYQALPAVINYLEMLKQDVNKNVTLFLNPIEEEDEEEDEEADHDDSTIFLPAPSQADAILQRYQINMLVEHNTNTGAPVIYEDNPTYQNLIGKIEHVSYMGSLTTNFSLIKAGALHRANGGYLLIDAHKLLTQQYAWEGIKRMLLAGEINIESWEQMFSMVSTISLQPQAIPLNIKVILLGEPSIYYLLYELDPEFKELFKVMADFNENMEWNSENNLLYAQLIGSLARKERLRALDRSAVARIIEYSARLAGNSERLSTHMKSITDLLRESDYWANIAKRPAINAQDVQKAIDTRYYRAGHLHDTTLAEITSGMILIDTAGAKVGQINGLSVLSLGDHRFARPSRITASVRLGKGEVIDIEREVSLGGPIHSKGVLILSGFLSSRYSQDSPFSLSARLVFEQSYSGIDGDSASSAELYAIISSLANIPIKQSLAVTGSVNQLGEIQAIGGVNEKIEGFFEVCQARGLTGEQGVLIPAANVKNLMLRHDVIDAVMAEKFHIYSVKTIDEGIEILMGLSAGKRNNKGNFPKGSINYLVESRLLSFAEKAMSEKMAITWELEDETVR